ncbi:MULTISPECIES: hypothetical protein [Pseudomonas aeruginosa group]|uniref:Uncharacterized protein n=1 Tax=Pseudomonas nitroreducens TaxID=46680 RepID=A0A6G6IS05_PSENT|nr:MULTISPECIES: hypothetical protein [Pseudomonas aeruginosa group]QIE85976.1 hypothetical protein G5B91_06725 [Pseudomonas nitroreducens]HCE6396376.1 hypothetical protein [Pseudomonas aeruginosa]
MLLLLCCEAWADTQPLQILHEVRSRGYLLCASAMVYYAPQDKEPDPRSLASYFDSLNQLQTRNVQLGRPDVLSETLEQMVQLLDSLEDLPRRDAARYPDKIGRLLVLQWRLDNWAAEQYLAQSGDSGGLLPSLHRQSLDIARMLLDYQARWYRMPTDQRTGLQPEERTALDGQIQERFERLLREYPDQAEQFDKLRKSYRYVRAQLLEPNPSLLQGGVEFYLVRNVIDLDELAMRLSIAELGGEASVGR